MSLSKIKHRLQDDDSDDVDDDGDIIMTLQIYRSYISNIVRSS